MKYILLLCMGIASLTLFAQDSASVKMFDRGLQLHGDNKPDSALLIFKEIVEKGFGKNSYVYGNSLFNVAMINLQLKKPEEAKKWFLVILDSDLKDSDETGELMEPHTNYKHNSAVRLARIHIREEKFTEALEWLYKADTVYRYWGFEGSATNVSKVQANLLAGKVYLLRQLHREDEAINEIISEFIHAGSLESFFSASEKDLLELIGDKKTFKAALDKGIESISIRKTDPSNWKAQLLINSKPITIHISSIRPGRDIPHYWRTIFLKEGQVADKDFIAREIRNRKFYKQLSE